MGKDKSGSFHPRKGKPSGVGKEKGVTIPSTDVQAYDEAISVEEKYTEGPNAIASNVRLRHPNRNVDKNEGVYTQKQNNDSNKSNNETMTEEFSEVFPEELAGTLSKPVFSVLADFNAECCVSVYLTFDKKNINGKFENLAFKNALQEVSKALQNKGIDDGIIVRMLEPGYTLLRDDQFWFNLTPGLAVFMADGFFKYIKLQSAVKEQIFINNSFYIAPLIPVITQNEYFFLLAISKKQAKFYRADAFGMQYISIPELPNGTDDVIHFEEKEDENLFRMGGRGGTGGANFHGVGAGKPDEKKNIAIYLEEVDRTLWKEVLHTESVPLLLAGVEYLIPIYKQVSTYKFIWDDVITGNHEHDETNALYERAKSLMQPYFQQRVHKALENYSNQSKTSKTSSIPADVIPAAYYGQVSQLFVEKDEHIWGTFNEETTELELHETQKEGDECLLDKAVMKTIQHGGEVFFLTKDHMPTQSKLVAMLRY